MSPRQGSLFPRVALARHIDGAACSTFADNMKLPVHRWFRYSAGFAAAWVEKVVTKERANGRTHILDPFAGSGTALLASEACGVESVGIEPHPFVVRVAKAKLAWRQNPTTLLEYAKEILREAKTIRGSVEGYPKLILKCFPSDTLKRLDSLRRAWDTSNKADPSSELAWLALISILRECSPVGTAQWQYVLPNKAKAEVLDPYVAFQRKIRLMADDMVALQELVPGPSAKIHMADARTCGPVSRNWAQLVVTSPPYANNYDYADATRLEMSFVGEVRNWGDLQQRVRRHLLRSCTQHVSQIVGQTEEMLENDLLLPVRSELTEVVCRLEGEREFHGGKKNYHTMIVAYFLDLAQVWQALRRVCATDSLLCFVVGDSAPYGIHVPVERWLGELALSAGFTSFRFEKTRDRNVKWKNRKHRVPLHEGRLWVKG